MSIMPTYYIYETHDGWRKSDERLTKQLNQLAFNHKAMDTAGCSFYPQWPKPQYLSETKTAWRITADGEAVARYYWAERKHQKSHGNCKMTEQGKCKFRKLATLRYDTQKGMWILTDQPDKLDDSAQH